MYLEETFSYIKKSLSTIIILRKINNSIFKFPCFKNSLNCFKDFIYFFLDGEEGRETEREGNINVWLPLMHPLLGTWPETQACALTGNQTGNPLVSKLALNPLSHTNQGKNSLSL